jgi:hypothetical protein
VRSQLSSPCQWPHREERSRLVSASPATLKDRGFRAVTAVSGRVRQKAGKSTTPNLRPCCGVITENSLRRGWASFVGLRPGAGVPE